MYVLPYTNSMIFSFSHHLQQDLGYSDVLGLNLLGFGIYVSYEIMIFNFVLGWI